jgi:hypothetical protein
VTIGNWGKVVLDYYAAYTAFSLIDAEGRSDWMQLGFALAGICCGVSSFVNDTRS